MHWLFYNWGFSKKSCCPNSISHYPLSPDDHHNPHYSHYLFFFFFQISDFFKICIWFCFGACLPSPGASGHSQVMAKHGAQKSVLSPDSQTWRKAKGGLRRGCPSGNDTHTHTPTRRMTQILASARQRPPHPPPLSGSVIGSVGSM